MESRGQLIGRTGHDATRLYGFALAVFPPLPQSGKCEQLAACQHDPIGLFALRRRQPIIETVCRDQAAPVFKRGPERWRGIDTFGPRIDQTRSDRSILRPARDESPTHPPRLALHVARRDHDDALGWCHVETRLVEFGLDRREVVEPELGGDIRRLSESEATAHCAILARALRAAPG
jgi:hypothetical protein